MKVKIKKLHPNAVIPSYAKEGDAGLDLTITSIKDDNKYIQFNFGVAIEIPKHFVGLIVPRSSITNTNLMMKNSVGVIDSGFRGELCFRCKRVKFEDGTQSVFYQVKERGAQLLILPCPEIELVEVDELTESERGTDGFGSTSRSKSGRREP